MMKSTSFKLLLCFLQKLEVALLNRADWRVVQCRQKYARPAWGDKLIEIAILNQDIIRAVTINISADNEKIETINRSQ